MNERICHDGEGQQPVTRTQASVAWTLAYARLTR